EIGDFPLDEPRYGYSLSGAVCNPPGFGVLGFPCARSREFAMRAPRIKIQRFMVAVVFLAIFLWAGPIVVPEFVLRWKRCQELASTYSRDARAYSLRATRSPSRLNPRRAAMYQSKADDCEKASKKYRRALLIPWDCWSLGD